MTRHKRAAWSAATQAARQLAALGGTDLGAKAAPRRRPALPKELSDRTPRSDTYEMPRTDRSIGRH
jgi:hypothetical protein